MSKNSMKFRVEWYDGAWGIVDPGNTSGGVRVDQLVIDATYVSTDKRAVEGFILSVHGLDFEVAQHLGRPVLNQLGVAANLRPTPPSPRRGSGVSRLRLFADDGRARVQSV